MWHTVREPWDFSPKRNETCCLLINSYFRKTLGKKQYVFETKKSHKLETLKCILKKTAMLLETSWLKNCGNFLVCHPKNQASSYPKSSSWKAQICYQQIPSIIRPLLIKWPNRMRNFMKQKPHSVSVGI